MLVFSLRIFILICIIFSNIAYSGELFLDKIDSYMEVVGTKDTIRIIPEKMSQTFYSIDLNKVKGTLSAYRRLYFLGQITHGLFIGIHYHGWFKN